MAINYEQLRDCVIIPTLKYLDPEIPYSEEAVDLLSMTCAHESNMGTFLKQVKGPALGVYQMEKPTHDDIHENYLHHRLGLDFKLFDLVNGKDEPMADMLVYNLMYATAMARVHYYRVPEAIPKKKDYQTHDDYLQALAEYCKEHYNTHLGKATASKYYWAYQKYCT